MRIFASHQCADYVHMSYAGADYVHTSYAGADEGHMARYICCRRSYVVSKPRWPQRAVIPYLHLHAQRMPSSASIIAI